MRFANLWLQVGSENPDVAVTVAWMERSDTRVINQIHEISYAPSPPTTRLHPPPPRLPRNQLSIRNIHP